MIKGFADKETAKLWQGEATRKLPEDILKRARQKLRFLNAAEDLDSLKIPPSNRLHPLKGEFAGQWALRINDQWRLCFRWEDGDAYDVQIIDYHS